MEGSSQQSAPALQLHPRTGEVEAERRRWRALRARQCEAERDSALGRRAQAPVNPTLELSNLPVKPRLDRQNRRSASHSVMKR